MTMGKMLSGLIGCCNRYGTMKKSGLTGLPSADIEAFRESPNILCNHYKAVPGVQISQVNQAGRVIDFNQGTKYIKRNNQHLDCCDGVFTEAG